MSILHSCEINPLNVHGLRRVQNCPTHFEKINFTLKTSEKVIADWIFENLSGRFFCGTNYQSEETPNRTGFTVGFELHHEASYFALQLDQINKERRD